ncbi:MAG: hypothetical protein OXG35_15940 [Acidobacteria bacterium]|nr:hypothetical protein [Acidobacteriota bacterium]
MTDRNARRARRLVILAALGLVTFLTFAVNSRTLVPGLARFEPLPARGPVRVMIVDPPPYRVLPAWAGPDGWFQVLTGRAHVPYDIEVVQPGCPPAVVRDVRFPHSGAVVPLPPCDPVEGVDQPTDHVDEFPSSR